MKFCAAPDRDVPRMRCGFPMPCPYHTETGARKYKMIVLLEDRAAHARGIPLKDGCVLGVRLGPRWRAICEKYLR